MFHVKHYRVLSTSSDDKNKKTNQMIFCEYYLNSFSSSEISIFALIGSVEIKEEIKFNLVITQSFDATYFGCEDLLNFFASFIQSLIS